MRRREFITLLGSAVTWPLAARAQQGERMRCVGVLLPAAADDAVYQTRLAAFLGGLQQLGWTDGRNVRIDTRWAAGDADLIRKYAGELVARDGRDEAYGFGRRQGLNVQTVHSIRVPKPDLSPENPEVR